VAAPFDDTGVRLRLFSGEACVASHVLPLPDVSRLAAQAAAAKGGSAAAIEAQGGGGCGRGLSSGSAGGGSGGGGRGRLAVAVAAAERAVPEENLAAARASVGSENDLLRLAASSSSSSGGGAGEAVETVLMLSSQGSNLGSSTSQGSTAAAVDAGGASFAAAAASPAASLAASSMMGVVMATVRVRVLVRRPELELPPALAALGPRGAAVRRSSSFKVPARHAVPEAPAAAAPVASQAALVPAAAAPAATAPVEPAPTAAAPASPGMPLVAAPTTSKRAGGRGKRSGNAPHSAGKQSPPRHTNSTRSAGGRRSKSPLGDGAKPAMEMV